MTGVQHTCTHPCQPHIHGCASMSQTYQVTIFYTEPTYEAHKHGNVSNLPTHRATCTVTTSDENRAKQFALTAFRSISRASSSGWIREVVKVKCVPVSSTAKEAER